MADYRELFNRCTAKLSEFVTRRRFGCLGALAGSIVGSLYGLIKGLIRPVDWATSGSSIYGAGLDGFQKFEDYSSDLFSWFLFLVGDILHYSIVFMLYFCVLAFILSWLVRFAIWFKNHFRMS